MSISDLFWSAMLIGGAACIGYSRNGFDGLLDWAGTAALTLAILVIIGMGCSAADKEEKERKNAGG